MLDIIIETIVDSLKILPFLFLSYILIEYIEHKASQKLQKTLSTSGKYSKIAGGLLGILPQCGFSAVAANLFSGRVITIGTLVAVFLATSDELIPIMVTHPEMTKDLVLILSIKLVIAIIAGTVIDYVFKKLKKNESKYDEHQMHEHVHDMCKNCDCEHGILKSSIHHTLSTFTFVLIITFVINIVIGLIGEDSFSKIILSNSIFQPLVASIIGLIPNCAASVLLSSLYIEGSLSLGSIIGGLSTGAGIGGLILFKTNKNIKENLTIVGLVYIIGAVCGILIDIVLRVI